MEMLLDGATKVFAVEVCVDLGREDALVAEQLLYLSDAGTPLDEVGGKGVAEGVGRDLLFEADAACRLLQDGEDHDARELLAAIVQEENLLTRFGRLAQIEVGVDAFACGGADWHEALLVALADDADVPLAKEEVADSQRYQLRDTQPTRVEHFEHRAVATPLDRIVIDGSNQAVNLLDRKGVGESAGAFRGLDEFGRGGVDGVAQEQKTIKTTDAAQRACLRGAFAPLLIEPREVVFDHRAFDLVGRDIVAAEDVVGEVAVVAQVGLHRVGRQATLQTDVGAVAFAPILPFC